VKGRKGCRRRQQGGWDADRIEDKSSVPMEVATTVPEDPVSVCEGPRLLIDVWIVDRGVQPKGRNGGVPILDHEMPFGHVQRRGGANLDGKIAKRQNR